MVARDLPAMCAQHVGCLRAVVLSGSLYATMHIVREPSLLPVSLVFQYLAQPHEPPLPQPVAPKLLRAADDLATIAWGALQGMVQVHDLGFVYGCAPNGNGPAVGFRRQQHCVQGVLLDFSCSTCLAHAHRGQAFALQADRDMAAALLKRCRSHLALASCALALERVTAALVQLHRARDLRQAASVLQDVQASCDRLARQHAADVERRRAGERAQAMEAERGAQQRAAAQRAREQVQEGADLTARILKRPPQPPEVPRTPQCRRLFYSARAAAGEEQLNTEASRLIGRWQSLRPTAADLASVTQETLARPLLRWVLGLWLGEWLANQLEETSWMADSLTVQQLTSATVKTRLQDILAAVPPNRQYPRMESKLAKCIEILTQHLTLSAQQRAVSDSDDGDGDGDGDEPMHQATAPSSGPEVISLVDVDNDDDNDLPQMLARKKKEMLLNAQKRTRIDAEVDKLMDNGVRIHPLCAQMHGGGDRSGEAAPAPSAAQPVGSAAAQSSAPGSAVDEL